jgi:hypothetical protein
MPGSWPQWELPLLTNENCVIRSPKKKAYNCIAWAAGDATRWWWPVPLRGINYWPKGVPREESLDAFILAFGTVGFFPCADGSLQDGVEKVALFAKRKDGVLIPTHAALQLESGEWTSKIGLFEDIHHLTLDAVNGPIYGESRRFLARQRNQPPDI